jgi:hypothetical protein
MYIHICFNFGLSFLRESFRFRFSHWFIGKDLRMPLLFLISSNKVFSSHAENDSKKHVYQKVPEGKSPIFQIVPYHSQRFIKLYKRIINYLLMMKQLHIINFSRLRI